MRYSNIPSTNLYPSVITLGTGPFGTGTDKGTAFTLLDTYFEHGGNFLDTARIYGAWVPGGLGLSEKVIGSWLKERGLRDKIILATKGAHPDMATRNIPRLSYHEIIGDLNDSLQVLQTDYVDLYWLHRDDPHRPVADILLTLNEQVSQGKIRYFGCSNWTTQRIAEAVSYARQHSLISFVANQPQWSLAQPNPETLTDNTLVIMNADLWKWHKETNMAIVPYTSQARGFFTKASTTPENLSQDLRLRYNNATNNQRLQRLQELSRQTGQSITALALAYLTNQTVPTFPIISSSHPDQLVESLEAGIINLNAEILSYLDGSTSGE